MRDWYTSPSFEFCVFDIVPVLCIWQCAREPSNVDDLNGGVDVASSQLVALTVTQGAPWCVVTLLRALASG